jgi:hypothetical protein
VRTNYLVRSEKKGPVAGAGANKKASPNQKNVNQKEKKSDSQTGVKSAQGEGAKENDFTPRERIFTIYGLPLNQHQNPNALKTNINHGKVATVPETVKHFFARGRFLLI